MASQGTMPRQGKLVNRLAVTGLLLRRLPVELGLVLTLIGVVLVSSLVAAGGPQLLNEMSDDGVHQAVQQALPINRNFSAEQGMRIPPDDPNDPFGPVSAQGTEIASGWPESMQRLIVDQQFVVNSPQFTVSTLPGEPMLPFQTFLRFRYQQSVADHIELVAGREPAPAEPVQVEGVEQPVPLIEIMATQEMLEELRVDLGGRLLLSPNDDDPLYRNVPTSALNYQVMIEVVGIFEALDPDEEYWFGDSRLLEPVIVQNPDFVRIYTEAVPSSDVYQSLLGTTGNALWSYNWRYFIDGERISAANASGLRTDVMRVQVMTGSSGFGATEELKFRTGLAEILEDFLQQRQLSVAVLSIAAAGLAIVAILTTGLLATLLAERRRELTIISRSRGASVGQLLTAQFIEAFIIAMPVAIIGYILARVFVPGRSELTSLIGALLVGIGFTIIAVLAAQPLIRRELGQLLSRRVAMTSNTSRRRLVVELLIVVLAVAGLVLIRRRGVAAGSLADPEGGFDPLLAVAPVLVVLAAGLILVRLIPIVFRLLAWLGSLRRDLPLFFGFRRMAEQSFVARLTVVVMLAAVGIAVFSAVVSFSIERGQIASTWQRVGADYRIDPVNEGAPLPSSIDLSGVDGVEAVADAVHVPNNQLVSDRPMVGLIDLYAFDVAGYQAVTEGTPISADFPSSMTIEQNVRGLGTGANPIPAIISSTWVDEQAIGVGDTFVLEVGSNELTFIVREVRDRFPAISSGQPFVIIPLMSLRVAQPQVEWPATRRYLRAPGDALDELRTTLIQQTFAANMISRDQLYSDLADAPLISGVRVGFALSVILAVVFAALAVVTALALTAAARARDMGYLRTLGLSSTQATLITFLEQIPVTLFAILMGTGIGILLVRLAEPGLDLAVFTGEGLPVTILVDWSSIILLLVGLMVVAGATIIGYSLLTRRMSLGQVLRLGDER